MLQQLIVHYIHYTSLLNCNQGYIPSIISQRLPSGSVFPSPLCFVPPCIFTDWSICTHTFMYTYTYTCVDIIYTCNKMPSKLFLLSLLNLQHSTHNIYGNYQNWGCWKYCVLTDWWHLLDSQHHSKCHGDSWTSKELKHSELRIPAAFYTPY